MKNKKLIIAIAVIAVLILLAVIGLMFKKSRTATPVVSTGSNTPSAFQPDFLTEAEKQELDLNTDLKIQALTRNPQGEVMVYKIIRTDKDIADPAAITASSSRNKR